MEVDEVLNDIARPLAIYSEDGQQEIIVIEGEDGIDSIFERRDRI